MPIWYGQHRNARVQRIKADMLYLHSNRRLQLFAHKAAFSCSFRRYRRCGIIVILYVRVQMEVDVIAYSYVLSRKRVSVKIYCNVITSVVNYRS